MKIGDISIAEAIIDLEYRISVLEQVIDQITRYSSNLNQNDVARFRKQALTALQNKYPNMGIKQKDQNE